MDSGTSHILGRIGIGVRGGAWGGLSLDNTMKNIRTGIVLLLVLGGCATTRTSFLLRSAREAESTGKDALAAERYIAVLKNPTTDPETRFQAQKELARLYFERLNRPEEGFTLSEQALAERPYHPDAAEVAWRMGKAAFDLGEFERARQAFLRVVLDMGGSRFDADARWGLAATYERLNEPENAQDVYTAFVVRHPDDPRRPEAERRLEALRRGTSLAAIPSPASPPVFRALERSVPRDNDEARRLDDAPPRRPIGPLTRPNARAELTSWKVSPLFGYNPRDLLFGEGGNLFGGEEVEASLRGDGALLDDALFHLGTLYFQLGDYRRAGACLEKVLQLGVEEPDAALNLAVCYLKENALKEAREAARRAFQLEPTSLSRMITYADSLKEQGDIAGAKAALTLLLGIDPARDETLRTRLRALSGN